MTSTAEQQTIGVAGRRLHVARWNRGASARRPLVMLNGIGLNLELLAPIARALSDREVICFDMPGIGRSPDPIVPYTISSMALTMATLLDKLEIDQVDILGISWGGALAQQFAFQHKARTGRLVLASTTAGTAMMPGDASMLAHLADPREYTVERSFRRNLASIYNGGGSDRVSLNAATAPSPLGFTYQLAAFTTWTSLPFLPLLSMPVLVMADDEDQMIPPSNAQFLHNAIPGSRLEMFHGGGHLFMFSQKDRFIDKLRAFLDEDASGA
ncbi:pimeloyl-ACP methyl ester carboxylesterase [Novosphingobium hassiacum]|uniref:Pimeloyl-ACP methyl ester carboxylesterase n=1 Tax=Novosphingobium hassiacum TaxID=173676 RepID=A0A7W6EU23_9SPHN|nr:pimeloyl-ACP methyl ester carboxylesterase [Novosphingobium hassiacum]